MQHETEHVCTPETCPEPGKYFVSARDAGRVYFMAGPYQTHAEALKNRDKALHLADKHDGRAWFMAWGTCRAADDCQTIGSLNRAGLL